MKSVISLAIMLCSLGAGMSSAGAWPVRIQDDHRVHTFTEAPQRVVALSWNGTENLLELDVTPVAIADAAGYRTWVARPVLPEGIADVGSRSQPNLERIAELRPDLILIGSQQVGLIPRLELIAPVLFFDSFRADHDNLQHARRDYLTLARVFDREAEAQQRLQAMEAELGQLAQQLHRHFGGRPPAVGVVRFSGISHALIYGENSLVQAALQALGLDVAIRLPATTWGVTQHPLTRLADIGSGALLYIEPYGQADALFASPLWQALPVARSGRVGAVESTWTYGGIFSVLYLAQAMSDALLTLERPA